jgi:threonine dehydrogenase-like Zn-dependent dehydrogenase
MAVATHAAMPVTATRVRSPTFGIVTCPGKAPELTAVKTDARAFWTASPGNGEIRTELLPSPSPDDVVVRALYSGISRGTETLVFRGRVPASEYERMRAPFQVGVFPGPVKYGYASVGVVEHGPPELLNHQVFCLHPHQTRFVVPAGSVHVIPDAVPPRRAVLAANLETAINGLWDANPRIGDRVAVIGAGTVGSMVAWLASRIHGCDVTLVDLNTQRAAIARALGVGFSTPAAVADAADVVIHASGSPSGLELALRVAGFEATIVELSWYGDQVVPMPLGQSFHSRRLTIRSSQVGSVASSQRARWDFRRRMSFALASLTDPALDALITGESPFESLPQVMASLADGKLDALCHRLRYDGGM